MRHQSKVLYRSSGSEGGVRLGGARVTLSIGLGSNGNLSHDMSAKIKSREGERQVSPEEMSRFFRRLAQKRWRNASEQERFRNAQRASIARWDKFRAWKEAHSKEAAAAASIARVARALGQKREPTDDEIVEQLERRLMRAQETTSKSLPWGSEFRMRTRQKRT
jgi:maltooligosyltrehalose synthase